MTTTIPSIFDTATRKRPRPAHSPRPGMEGDQFIRLMRKHKVTIRDLKKRTGFTLKRIREVRSGGLVDPVACRDWVQAITETDPGPAMG